MKINGTGDYSSFYAAITAPFRSRPMAVKVLGVVNRLLALVIYVFYPLMLLGQLWMGWQQGGVPAAVFVALPYVMVPGISFVLVTVVRDRINGPRPYETWPIDPLIHKDTKGHSMPSRHVFSATVIAMCALDLSLPLGIVMLFLSAAIAVIRVLGGVHYPKDVAAGFLIGVLSGCVLFLL